MLSLKVFLLGSPRIECAGTLVAIRRRKALALLAYLAVAGQPQRRDTVATLMNAPPPQLAVPPNWWKR